MSERRTPAAALVLPTLRLSQRGRVLTARIQPHPAGSFLSAAQQRDLLTLARAVDRDDGVRTVVVTGAGPGEHAVHDDIASLLAAVESAPFLSLMTVAAARASAAGADARLMDRLRITGGVASGYLGHRLHRLTRPRTLWLAAIDHRPDVTGGPGRSSYVLLHR